MAKRKAAPKRETARVDPPQTTLDPSGNLLKLVDPDGRPLKAGGLTERFQYCWVRKNSDHQLAQYQGLGYRPCRYADDEVRPAAKMFTEFEDSDGKGNGYIERSDVWLMKRPIEYYHAQLAAGRDRERTIRKAIGKVDRGDQRFANANHSVIRVDGPGEQATTFGG